MKVNKIYNADFREYIGEVRNIDMVITDPPYNIGFKYDAYEDNLTDNEYINLIANLKGKPLAIIHYPEETMKYFVPALGVPNEVITWCYNSNLPNRQSRLINFYNCKVDLNRIKQPYKNPTDRRVKKLIEQGKQGSRMYDWFSDIQLVKNVSKDKINHPCPIPVKLYERIILLTTNEGDTVLDPFAGQGNFAIACINTNRNFIGFELSKKYCEIAEQRIMEAKCTTTKRESVTTAANPTSRHHQHKEPAPSAYPLPRKTSEQRTI